ncbi:MAG: DUF6252 family protein [Bacteroidota bacterium]
MKKIFYSLMVAGVLGLAACSNGDYEANPDSNTNSGINPIDPLTSDDFNWSGGEPVSATINGAGWKADAAYLTIDSTGANVLVAVKGHQVMAFYLRDVWKGNVYDIGFKQEFRHIMWSDSVGQTYNVYDSKLGNSAGIKIIENNDSLNVFSGQFYFKGVSPKGDVVNVTNGYFKVTKH